MKQHILFSRAGSPRTPANGIFIPTCWVGVLVGFCCETARPAASSGAENREAIPLAQASQRVPGAELGKVALKFSATPTVEEISHTRLFEEPLVPVGGEPGVEENAALATALLDYRNRTQPDDFSSLTRFLEEHPGTAWRAALLTCLGFNYYKTAHYSLALGAWREAWSLGQEAASVEGRLLADRAVCELAGLYSWLGRMNELEALLKSVEGRAFVGGATERMNLAREALWMMQNRPEVSFRCGPLALQSIKHSLDPQAPGDLAIFNSASTQQGFSLAQVAELSKKVGLHYQMAFRKFGESVTSSLVHSSTYSPFVVPSVVHWKVGHYAALVRQVGDQYLLEDPTFGNTVWATRQALEAETSGYFLIPPGDLPRGWRAVDEREGGAVWGKGVTGGNDPDQFTCGNEHTGSCGSAERCGGMAVATVHLMLANLQVKDTPVGYIPPIGPPVTFTVRYNHRDYLQSPSLISSMLGPKWTHDWNGTISDNPNSPLSDVRYLAEGGGARTFTGFNTNTQTFAPQQYDHTLLQRIGANPFTSTYEMVFPDGSKKIYGLRTPSGAVLLTQVLDPAGNAVTLTYDSSQRLVSLTDAIGQVTTISYEEPQHTNLITKVTDPFGRFAKFDYTNQVAGYSFHGTCPTNLIVETNYVARLYKITDVLGLTSTVAYEPKTLTYIGYDPATDIHCTNNYGYTSDLIISLSTPYGTTTFTLGDGPQSNATMRFAEIHYPDGSRERIEYNQSSDVGIPINDPFALVPIGMPVLNNYLWARNTYYWNRNASMEAYGDYTKARIYHWLHSIDSSLTSGILESTKEPLEGRVWYAYPAQTFSGVVGGSNRPRQVGRVLDDGSTQLYTYDYNGFGHVTNMVDPIGRTLSFIYSTNGIDLLEVRQTRAGNNELLSRRTYNSQHRPLNITDAAGQTTTFTYNGRGQVLTARNPKGDIVTYNYNANGYLVMVDGPLPGTNDVLTFTYDPFGRIRTFTDVNGYTLTSDYDSMDRAIRVTCPDGTFTQYTYDRLHLAALRDRAGRTNVFEHDNMRQVTKQTDPLGHVTQFEWCGCGALKNLTDPLGRRTSWLTDVQGRLVRKQYPDGSQIDYSYEKRISRLQQVVDQRHQSTTFTYNRDDTLKTIGYANTTLPTPGVSLAYDPNYPRLTSMVDGTGRTLYSYVPITDPPPLGAGRLASVDGPLPDDTISYGYDELGRGVSTAINGVGQFMVFDPAGRVASLTNALGSFTFTYDGASGRILSETFPNGQTASLNYGSLVQDFALQTITHQLGATPVSQFLYTREVPAHRIITWSQQVGAQRPNVYSFAYDAGNQLLSAAVTNSGVQVSSFAYNYDAAANRLAEQVGGSNYIATYNALNELSATTGPVGSRTNEWDGLNRLTAVNAGNQRTEFTYDGRNRLVGIRQLVNKSEVSHRFFVWKAGRIREERDTNGTVTKRFFLQGVQIITGTNAGRYYYTRDHLGSIRELSDASGNVRARYAYDPFGRRSKVGGDLDADFGFAGMFWSAEANLSFARFRAYDAALGRWLARDPLSDSEVMQGPNLYAYVANDPVDRTDPSGLTWDKAFLEKMRARLSPEQFEILLAKYENRTPVMPWEKVQAEPEPLPLWTDEEMAGGEIVEVTGGEIVEVTGGEIEEAGGEIMEVPVLEPLPERFTPTRVFPGVSGAFSQFVGAGITILTMTDCNTVEGILALVRQGKGGLANKYEDRMMKELNRLEGW